MNQNQTPNEQQNLQEHLDELAVSIGSPFGQSIDNAQI